MDDRPTLMVQTVYFGRREDAPDALTEATRLGDALYHCLTRPTDKRFAFGAGVPVRIAVPAASVNVEAAELVVLVPVLDAVTFQLHRCAVLEQLASWHKGLGPGQLLPLPISDLWRGVESQLLGKPLLTMLCGDGDRKQRTVDEIVLALTRVLEPDAQRRRLFVSHAKADIGTVGTVADDIQKYVNANTTGSAFFDVVSLEAGKPLAPQLGKAAAQGVFLAIRGDAYGTRAWCQRELRCAKRAGMPTLTVEVIKDGVRRIAPYGGNGPSVVWRGEPAAIAARAVVEWLRSALFHRDAKRLIELERLPADTKVLSRPPELLDFAQGPLNSGGTILVLHPDPELPVEEQVLLRQAHPRLRLATPTTIHRHLLSRGGKVGTTLPLQGWQVALSLSDAAGPGRGVSSDHVVDAVAYLARCLIAAGGEIAYGGDFRRTGFTRLLVDVIAQYNETAREPNDYLHSYLGAVIDVKSGEDVAVTKHHMSASKEMQPLAVLAPPAAELAPHRAALYFSDMRRAMALRTQARIVLSGSDAPRLKPGGKGYGGRFPGVVEEAWRSLMMEPKQPLYVVGGFGGAAALLAALFEGADTPTNLQDDNWMQHDAFKERAAAIDNDPDRARLGLPDSMDALAAEVREAASACLATDESAVAWNGLNRCDNKVLLRTQDPVVLTSLVMKGLLRVARKKARGKLSIELVKGSVTGARELDLIAVATFDHMSLGGAGAALDRLVAGRASAARAVGQTFVELQTPEVDAQWLHLASLGSPSEVDRWEEKVHSAARSTAERCHRFGVNWLGVVAFGGSVFSDMAMVAKAMLDELTSLADTTSVVWFESDEGRFKALLQYLGGRDDIALSVRHDAAEAPPRQAVKENCHIYVKRHGEVTHVTMIPPSGGGTALSCHRQLSQATLDGWRSGTCQGGRRTPPMAELQRRGLEMTVALLGTAAFQLFDRCADARLLVTHDMASSNIPFELLMARHEDGSVTKAAVAQGVSRRLAIQNIPLERLFAGRPRSGKLRLLLMVGFATNLPSAEAEAAGVRALVAALDNVVLQELDGTATAEDLRRAFVDVDVLHYIGHAHYSGPGADDSGLILGNGDTFTAAQLLDLPTRPRVVFANACETGRVRGAPRQETTAFAEMVLRSGVEAYIGTTWRVADQAATHFATSVYGDLADGQTLYHAVKKGRDSLHGSQQADWANYRLFGDGRFRLVTR